MPRPDLAGRIVEVLSDGAGWSKARLFSAVAGFTESEASLNTALQRLKYRQVIGTRIVGRDCLYFRDQRTADAAPAHVVEAFRAEMYQRRSFSLAKAAAFGKAAKLAKAACAKASPAKAGVQLPAPVTFTAGESRIKPQLADELVITERTRITVAPPVRYDARYQVDPGAKHYGAGFAAAGLGRDVTTGRSWGA